MRRLTFAALFVVVAAAGCRGGSPTALQRAGEPGGSDGFFALWPEHTLKAAMQAQARTDAGQHPWRLDPAATAEHFARDVLGREEVIVRTCPFEQEPNCWAGDISRPNTSFLHMSWRQGASDLIAQVDRLVRPGEGGIWSVSWVGDAGEDLPAGFELPPGVEEDPSTNVGPGAEIPAGATVLLRSARQDAEGVVAGYVYRGPCQTEGFGTPVRKVSVFLEFEVATRAANDACLGEGSIAEGFSSVARSIDGVVFAASIRSGPAIEPARLGAWLFDPSQRTAETPTALERIVDVAAMPVRFVPAGVKSVTVPTPESTAPTGDGGTLDITFPDGSEARIALPAGQDLRSFPLQPDVSLVWPRQYVAPIVFSRGGPYEAILAGTEPEEQLSTGETLWRSKSVSSHPSLSEVTRWVVFSLPDWSVHVPVPPNVRPDDLADAVDPEQSPDGLVVVRVRGPFVLADSFGEGEGSQVAIGDRNPLPGVVEAGPQFNVILLAPDECTGGRHLETDIGGPDELYASLCLADGELFASVYGDADFVRDVHGGLGVVSFTSGSGN